MFIRMIKSLNYTRRVYKISRILGGSVKLSVSDKSTENALRSMRKLWEKNDLLSPLVNKYGIKSKDLEDYYWLLSANGAGQWVSGYFVPVASLCFPRPLEYVLKNKESKSIQEMAFSMLGYFENGNPYLPIEA